MGGSIKRTSICTEAHTILGVLGQESNETPYVLCEGRRFIDPPQEILEGYSGSRLEKPYKAKR